MTGKPSIRLTVASGLVLCCLSGMAQPFSLPPQTSPELSWWRDSIQTRDERLGWWREARFGMFVHWGVYSSLGKEYEGRKGGTYAEHIQRVLKIPIPEYRAKVAGGSLVISGANGAPNAG